ncbi:MAG: periplasmic heavy metal sensor [Gemmatimonadota bacterium]|jgi:Spy/CpxP family protein refolding chaperone
MIFARSELLVCGAALAFAVLPASAQESSKPGSGMGGMHQRHGQTDGGMRAGGGMGGGPMLSGISEDEKEALLAGSGLGAGMIAMANGYPGPKHVLEMGDELGLTAEQKEEIGSLFAERKASFVELGTELVKKDEQLTAMFASGSVNTKDVEKLAREIGQLQGELRAGHLNAHVLTWEALTAAQREKVASMRGMHRGGGEGMQRRMQQGGSTGTTTGT